MSGFFPSPQLKNEDPELFHVKSVSPIDISSMKFSDEDWLTSTQDPIEHEKETPKPKPKSIDLDQEIPKLRHRTLGPEPLLPNKFHPLCYCYRLPEDYDHYPPRVYCIGEPSDDDIVIYSDKENLTWLKLKEAKPNTPNLSKIFPFLQLKTHQEEEEEHFRSLSKAEAKVAKQIDYIKRVSDWERNRLEVLFQAEIEEIIKLKLKLNRNTPNLKRMQNSLDINVDKKDASINRRDEKTQQRRNNLKCTTSLSTSSLDRNSLKVRGLDKVYSLSDENVRDKVRKAKPSLPNYTREERLHYERFGCTKLELEERKWQEKKMKAGVWL